MRCLTAVCVCLESKFITNLTLPSQRDYRLRDDQYLLAVRKRLGLLPDSSLLHDSCLACHGRNLQLPEFKLDPHHSEACVRHTGASVTERHDGIVRVLGELARSVGASVRTELRVVLRCRLDLHSWWCPFSSHRPRAIDGSETGCYTGSDEQASTVQRVGNWPGCAA